MRPNRIMRAHVHNNHNKLHVVNDGRHPRSLREKAYHKQQFIMNVIMRYNCANIPQRAV